MIAKGVGNAIQDRHLFLGDDVIYSVSYVWCLYEKR